LAESVRLLLLLLGYLYCSGTGPAFRATVATPGLVLSVQPDWEYVWACLTHPCCRSFCYRYWTRWYGWLDGESKETYTTCFAHGDCSQACGHGDHAADNSRQWHLSLLLGPPCPLAVWRLESLVFRGVMFISETWRTSRYKAERVDHKHKILLIVLQRPY